ncbi:MAG: TraR/DksA family transcriptional regulator [Lentisphaerae bacterium]|jgi:DnaK suppressor protein|nr:TraR/DksA family transcriptional regulator [Lentisphaerota bacterium]
MVKKKTATPAFTAELLAEFKELLLQERSKIERRLKSSTTSLSSTQQAGEEGPDVGSDNFIRDTGLTLMGENSDILAQINDALSRIASGTYGVCFDCGHVIGAGRLRVRPYAQFCIDCKSARETNDGFPSES